MVKMMPGKVYLVGAGPGDPGLITIKGLECLARADVVLYDGLVNPLLLRHRRQRLLRPSRQPAAVAPHRQRQPLQRQGLRRPHLL